MTTVTVSEFRNKLSNYLDLLIKGEIISITDGRKGKKLLTIKKTKKKKKEFDWDEYMKFLDNFEPFLTDKDVSDMKRFRKATNKRLKENNW